VARRYSGNPNPHIQLGALQINTSDHTILLNGSPVELTAREWAVFEALLQRRSALLSKAQLEERLYEFGAEIESNTIEVYISRLRKKLGRQTIQTVRGIGYRLGSA
jgi:two-component system OmpR family response regulator